MRETIEIGATPHAFWVQDNAPPHWDAEALAEMNGTRAA